ncbi:fructose-1,6-bisphosphatase [Vaginisenegalia massiliensis]|uniref:fructose-1,6-bisphosphatase n=1 Tax=Vaginisenegalia massiliensis TaxID=2058294 RepID=UPI000F525571|nr:fructose-1,6-bisphosphatase [Vaginisenegalia massiliensis]
MEIKKSIITSSLDQEKLNDLSEIINLEAIQQLPKATEHFISDVHGEFEAFDHILRNCSGIIRLKIATLFKDRLTEQEQKELCFNIYYPEDKIVGAKKSQEEWQALLTHLVELTRFVSSKYTRSKVRKAMPSEYAYILEELLYQYDEDNKKADYYQAIFTKIIDLDLAENFAVTLANLIRHFVVDHLHLVGDIYDRGPHPDLIIDSLMQMPSMDFQLGNHDLIWIGAMSGSMACLATVLRITMRYGHLALLEKDYGINISRLAKFAHKHYQPLDAFAPRGVDDSMTQEEKDSINRMHQAISIIQFKLEGHIIKRRPEFKMDHRLQLTQLTDDRQTLHIDGVDYPVIDGCFQNVKEDDPFELSIGEELVMVDLFNQFLRSDRLKRHIDFLVEKGSLYLIHNNNLLFHGCLPCTPEGDFMELEFDGQRYKGKALMDFYTQAIQTAYADPFTHDDLATDLVWYLWCGEGSSLFGKKDMKTFERYFTTDKALHKEAQNSYYKLRNDESFCLKLMQEFGLDGQGYIINGHTPVKAITGENPIKANGKMIVIDGGLATPYQKVTGIAGYTLVDNSHEVYIVSHHPFTSKEDAIQNYYDIIPTQEIVHKRIKRASVKDTDIGRQLGQQAESLKAKYQLN